VQPEANNVADTPDAGEAPYRHGGLPYLDSMDDLKTIKKTVSSQ
jgi:hypothetical protein